jgi:hypothetical protein
MTATLVLPASLFSSSITEPQHIEVVISVPKNALAATTLKTGSAQWVTIILTGFFTLLGSAVVLVYNYIAGSSARKFEWGKYLWDKYQKGYLDLRQSIRETTDAEVIENKTRSLMSQVVLPPKLEKELIDLIAVLRSMEASEEKAQKTKDFLESFEEFVARPWMYL